MSDKNIKLVTTDRTATGYNHVALYIGNDELSTNDSGILYLTDDELETLTEIFRSGIADINADQSTSHTFDREDNFASQY